MDELLSDDARLSEMIDVDTDDARLVKPNRPLSITEKRLHAYLAMVANHDVRSDVSFVVTQM